MTKDQVVKELNNLKDIKVSYFKNPWTKVGVQIELSKVLDSFSVSGANNYLIEALRSDSYSRQKKVELKKGLPAILFQAGGTARKMEDLKNPSGLMCLDFDKYETPEDVLKAKERFKNDPYTLACFVSPSGNGLKVLVRIPKTLDNERYGRLYNSIGAYYNDSHFDEATKDLSRLCFYTYDPQLFVNSGSKVWEGEAVTHTDSKQVEEGEKGEKKADVCPLLALEQNSLNPVGWEALKTILQRKEFKKLTWEEGERNNNLFKLACALSESNLEQEYALNSLGGLAVSKGLTRSEAKATIKSAYSKSESKMSSKFVILNHFIERTGIVFNELSCFYEVNGECITDDFAKKIANDASNLFPTTTPMDVERLITPEYIKSVHPYKQYLKKLEKRPLIEGSVARFLDCIRLDERYPADVKNKLITKWMGGIVGTLCGNYSVTALVLTGGQGIGKTKFFRGLLPDELNQYFAPCAITDDKDVYKRMCTNLIVYDDEFTGRTKTEAAAFKKVISSDNFTFRPPYGRRDIRMKRSAIVCGSANDIEVINDLTGNRRILPLEIKFIDHVGLSKINMNDVYKELYELQKENPEWWYLTAEDIALLNTHTEDSVIDFYRDELDLFTEPTDDKTLSYTALEVANHIDFYSSTFNHRAKQFAQSLKRRYPYVRTNRKRAYRLKLVTPNDRS